MTTSIKTCFKCGLIKTLDAFYRHPAMKDGHLNKCIDCAKADIRLHRRSDKYREKVLTYDRNRGNRQSKEYRDNHRKEYEGACKARNAVSNAVRDGNLVRPKRCEHCGSDGVLHGHHHDYGKPLCVVWLCVACHRQIHALMDLVARAEERSAIVEALSQSNS